MLLLLRCIATCTLKSSKHTPFLVVHTPAHQHTYKRSTITQYTVDTTLQLVSPHRITLSHAPHQNDTTLLHTPSPPPPRAHGHYARLMANPYHLSLSLSLSHTHIHITPLHLSLSLSLSLSALGEALRARKRP